MTSEKLRTEAELLAEGEPNEAEVDSEAETATPSIDEDVAGSVNAAVPDTADGKTKGG
jgi:hypothetical protein